MKNSLKIKMITLFGALCLCLVAADKAFARDWYVSTTGSDLQTFGSQSLPFRTIQRGLDFAANGERVIVADGTYSGTGNYLLTFRGKNVTLKSLSGDPAACIIDCQQQGRAFEFPAGSTSAMIVDGFTVKNSKTTQAAGNGTGGAIAVVNSSPTIRNCIFADNQTTHNSTSEAAGGGAVIVSGGSPTFENCRFERNIANSSTFAAFGGAIFSRSNSNITLTNCTFLSNQAKGVSSVAGGAVFVEAGQTTATDCRFEDNRVSGQNISGGAVYVKANAQAALLRCDLINNRVTTSNGQAVGGALLVAGRLSLTQCTVSQNRAQGTSLAAGGGMSAGGNATLTLINTTVSQNTVQSDDQTSGGGLYLQDSVQALLLSSNIVSNTTQCPSQAAGGGIMASGSVALTATNSLVKGNTARSTAAGGTSRGGGIAATGSGAALTLNNTTCSENLAVAEGNSAGGGIEVSTNAQVVLRSSRIVFNTAQSVELVNGGGIAAVDASLTATNSLVGGNAARSGNIAGVGGGILLTNTPTTLTNTLIVNNVAEGTEEQEVSKGGGLYVVSGNRAVTVTHCILTGNQSHWAGAIYSRETSFTLSNSIVAANSEEYTSQISFIRESIGFFTFSHCCVGDFPYTPDANGNFGADPLFVRNASAGADGNLATPDDDLGDLRLQSGSPCINAGTASAPNEPPYDLDGFVRIVGSAPDVGAYEFGSTVQYVANLYVDKAAGNDTTGNGTATAPFQTVTKALSVTDQTLPATVHIKAGNYGTDRPRVMGKVRFVNWGNTGRASIGKP